MKKRNKQKMTKRRAEFMAECNFHALLLMSDLQNAIRYQESLKCDLSTLKMEQFGKAEAVAIMDQIKAELCTPKP